MTEQRRETNTSKIFAFSVITVLALVIAIIAATTIADYERLKRQEQIFQVLTQMTSSRPSDTVFLPDNPETRDLMRAYYVTGWISLGTEDTLINGFEKSADGPWTLPAPYRDIYDEPYHFDLVFIHELKGFRFTGRITPRNAWIHEMESFDVAPNAILESEPK